jgi:uncharacterized protein
LGGDFMNNKKLIYLVIFLLFIIFMLIYSRFVATSSLVVNEINVKGLTSSNFHGTKVLHITDLHYGRTVNSVKRLNQIKDKINLSKPDIIVLTGDLIDKDTVMTDDIEKKIITFLKELDSRLGKYAIKGNHDMYFENWEKIIIQGDFLDVNDSYELIYKNTLSPILISGISTNLGIDTPLEEKESKLIEYLDSLDASSIKPEYKILLIHEPDYLDDIDLKKYDLIFAGHSHNGQVRAPFFGPIFLPEGAKNYYDSYYKIQNKDVYISSGIGTSLVNFRLFNRPSVNLYRLLKK